jgi:hypothetical protein
MRAFLGVEGGQFSSCVGHTNMHNGAHSSGSSGLPGAAAVAGVWYSSSTCSSYNNCCCVDGRASGVVGSGLCQLCCGNG